MFKFNQMHIIWSFGLKFTTFLLYKSDALPMGSSSIFIFIFQSPHFEIPVMCDVIQQIKNRGLKYFDWFRT